MKRILNLGVLFSLLFVGCQDEQLAENKLSNSIARSVEINAEIDGEHYSRTYTERDESDTKNLYKWDKDDLLSVFMGDATEISCFKIAKLSEDGRTAGFRGDIVIWGGAEEDGNPHLSNVAFYPYSENLKSVSYNKDDASFTLTANLPSTQTWSKSGTFATNTAPMIAVTEDASSYSFRFKAIMAVTQLHLKASDVFDAAKIVKAVMTVDDYSMAGNYTVTSTFDGVQSVVAAENAVCSVSMENAEGIELDTENKVVLTFVHFPLPETEEEKVVKFDLYDSKGNYMTHVVKTKKAFTDKNFVHVGKSNPVVYSPTGSLYAFRINDEGYNTLDEAIAAAQDKDVIQIVNEGTYILPTQLQNSNNLQKLTFKGKGENTVLSFNTVKGQADGGLNCYADGMELVFENMKIVSPNTGSSYSGGFGRATAVTFNGCIYEGQYRAVSAKTTFDNCTIDSKTSYIYTDYADADFNDCIFNASEGKAIQVYNDGNTTNTTINVKNCTFTAAKEGHTRDGKPVTAIDINSNGEIFNVNINNTAATGFGIGQYSESKLWNIKGGDNYVNLAIDGVNYVTSASSLAQCLTANEKTINVVLCVNIDLPISSLGQMTGGSGEYKLGGEDTENFIVDLNGKKLNITTTYWSNLGAKNDDALFTIKNGNMTSSQATGTWNSYDVTFSNCNYAFEDVVFEKAIAFANAGKSVSLKNVTINETHDYYPMWITAEGQQVVIDGLTINSSGRGVKIDEQYVGTPAKVTLNINNATFKTAKKAAIVVKSVEGAEINVENIDISEVAADEVFAVWVDEDAAANEDKVVVNGALCKVEGSSALIGAASNEELQAVTIEDNAKIYLTAGEYVVPATAKGKNVTFIGTGNPEDVKVAVTKVGSGGENCDYGLDGSTVTFEGITITTNSSNYIGYARCNGTYKNCIINGTYTLYGNSTFENCTFNVSGNVYNVWTWGAPTATFDGCTFNSDGKAMLLYGQANTKLTIENCVFNDKGGLSDLKAAIEIGNDYNKSYELIVNNTTVNGYEINDKGINTGTTLWANKNSMGQDKLNVVVDGVDIY